jgi:hypothetical protein
MLVSITEIGGGLGYTARSTFGRGWLGGTGHSFSGSHSFSKAGDDSRKPTAANIGDFSTLGALDIENPYTGANHEFEMWPDILAPAALNTLVSSIFNDSTQLLEILAACLAKPTKNKPRGVLRDADFLCQLHRRNALARRHNEIHRVNPILQRNVRPLENRPGANREIFLALVAAIEAILADRDPVASPANRRRTPLGQSRLLR